MTAIRQITGQFTTLSLAAKIGIGIAILVVIALLLGGTAGIVSHFKDKKADRAIAAERAKSEEHRQRADEAEERAKGLATKAAVAEVAIQAVGAKAEAIAEKIKVEDAKLIEEMERIGEPVDDPCVRVKRICAKLSIKPADCTCTAN